MKIRLVKFMRWVARLNPRPAPLAPMAFAAMALLSGEAYANAAADAAAAETLQLMQQGQNPLAREEVDGLLQFGGIEEAGLGPPLLTGPMQALKPDACEAQDGLLNCGD